MMWSSRTSNFRLLPRAESALILGAVGRKEVGPARMLRDNATKPVQQAARLEKGAVEIGAP